MDDCDLTYATLRIINQLLSGVGGGRGRRGGVKLTRGEEAKAKGVP